MKTPYTAIAKIINAKPKLVEVISEDSENPPPIAVSDIVIMSVTIIKTSPFLILFESHNKTIQTIGTRKQITNPSFL